MEDKIKQIKERIEEYTDLKTEANEDEDFHMASHYKAIVMGLVMALKIVENN